MSTNPPLETLSPIDEEDFAILVQPKLVFANERTFLAYMHTGVLLSGVALGMLNFGSKQALISAFMFSVLSVAAMIYALKTYHSRATSILSGAEDCFSDRLGPSLLLLAFLTINFTLRFAEL